MTGTEINAAWRAVARKDLGPGGFFDVVKQTDRQGLFNNWKLSTVPVGDYFLGCSIDLLCGAPEQAELVATFLGYVRQQIERAETEPQRWDREEGIGAWGGFMKAIRWYRFQRADLYSRALLGQAFVVEPRHIEALQANAAHYAAQKGRDWDEMAQSGYIESALVAAAWGHLEMAQTLLAVKRSFKYTQRYVDWSRALIAQLSAQAPGEGVDPGSALWAHFHSLFNEVRHPTRLLSVGEAAREAARRGEAIESSSWPQLRLMLAMLKQRYLINKPIEPGLRDLIALIAE